MFYYRDTFIDIDLDAVYENVMNLKKYHYQDVQIMAVVKADSYGHGAVMIARTLIEAKVSHFAVATIDEALELRQNGISEPILVFGGIDLRYLEVASNWNLTISVHSLSWLKKALMHPQKKLIGIHLKVDSGMNRLGFTDESELLEAVRLLKNDGHFCLKGIYSHLATSEEADETFYQLQVNRFEQMLSQIDKKDLLIHLANSAGSVKPRPAYVNMVRIGLFINGICPSPAVRLAFDLKPSLSLSSRLIQVKSVPAHSKISYNGLYETTKETIIGTIPIGYADGYDRRIKDGRVWVDGMYAKIVGRVCMDLIMVELSRWVEEGTLVELIGPHVTLYEYSSWINTNTYHATCAFSDRIPRIYHRFQSVIAVVNRRIEHQF